MFWHITVFLLSLLKAGQPCSNFGRTENRVVLLYSKKNKKQANQIKIFIYHDHLLCYEKKV